MVSRSQGYHIVCKHNRFLASWCLSDGGGFGNISAAGRRQQTALAADELGSFRFPSLSFRPRLTWREGASASCWCLREVGSDLDLFDLWDLSIFWV